MKITPQAIARETQRKENVARKKQRFLQGLTSAGDYTLVHERALPFTGSHRPPSSRRAFNGKVRTNERTILSNLRRGGDWDDVILDVPPTGKVPSDYVEMLNTREKIAAKLDR